MGVQRCICHDVGFDALIALSQRDGLSLEQLSERTGCGTGCGSCVPYIRLALALGKSDLPVMTPDELRRALELATCSDSKPREAGPHTA
ncbi:MAG: (2Fe-2S)-binding protein [Planctomycetota bacterium]